MLDDSNISAECYMRHNGMTQKLLTETPRHQIHSGKQKCHIQSKNIHNIILSQKWVYNQWYVKDLGDDHHRELPS